MRTPICDFLEDYAKRGNVRMHMPGHKGHGDSIHALDLTEVTGADSLFLADGIIKESEMCASEIFGALTYYSTEGSSLCIRAMVRLISLYAASLGKSPLILAARNAHRSFVSAISLTGCNVEWLCGAGECYLSCKITPKMIDKRLCEAEPPTAVYVTSPDYLGCTCDIEGIAKICHKHGVLLAVDNAHGAYLKFLSESRHPMDLAADICCDSAHKTLPAMTGTAYLHINHEAPKLFFEYAKDAMALFASTSPSYILLASLDRLNSELSTDFKTKMQIFVDKITLLKWDLANLGFELYGDEPAKITILTKSYGYLGEAMAEALEGAGIVCEFSDSDHLVLMPSPSNTDDELERLSEALGSLPRLAPIDKKPPTFSAPTPVMTPAKALSLPYEYVPCEESVGRILAEITVGCPPAVPIAVSGELITRDIADAFVYYGAKKVAVVK
ncbi:MAG: PLP-dependent transferase [Clostridia bacterium]|nr:PLP-dependent transferase [Clostridia bacterium]